MTNNPHKPTSVNKIGGKNMTGICEVKKLVETLRDRNENVILVVSAFDGVTNALLGALNGLDGTDFDKTSIDQAFSKTKKLHDCIIELHFTDMFSNRAKTTYQRKFNKLKQALLTHRNITNILSPIEGSFSIRDQVIGFGEAMGQEFLKIYLEQEGFEAETVTDINADSDVLNGGGAISNNKLHDATRKGICKVLEAQVRNARNDVIKILGGHVGNMPRGIAIDVGRSYTDTTAINVALVLREMVGEVITRVWKDVDGVMSTNPKDLKDPGKAIHHSKVDIWEGLEMASAGSILMQIDALALAAEHGLNVSLRNIKKPNAPGTDFLNVRLGSSYSFKVIAVNPNVDSISITLPEMANRKGFGAAITGILAHYGLSYDINPTGGTSMSFSITLPPDEAEQKIFRNRHIKPALRALKKLTVGGESFRTHEITWIRNNDRTAISLIGNEISSHTTEIIGRMAIALSQKGILIRSIVQDEKARRITLLIDTNKREEAIRSLHTEFFEEPEGQEPEELVA